MVTQAKAPAGGTRISGKWYRGGSFVPSPDRELEPTRYRKILEKSTRPRDPASTLPNVPPNFGRSVLPHLITFSGMQSTLSRSYRHADEALRDSIVNAHMMLNDPMIVEPLLARMTMTALYNWHLEVEDETDPRQKAMGDELTKMIEQIPYFTKYRQTLLWSIWFGRYGIENEWGMYKTSEGQRRYNVVNHVPIDGDKMLFRFDDGRGEYEAGQVGIRVSPALSPHDRIAGERRLEPTAEGLAYFLEPWERRHWVIHKHLIIDGHWEDPLSGGKIHGTGIRSFVYWLWYQKQEALAQLAEIVERTAQGVHLYWYPSGNDAALAEMEQVAREQAHTNTILLPRTPETDDYGYEHIPFNAGGVEILQKLIIDHFGHLIKRLIIGQTLSSEADATGLGSGLADLQESTMLQIAKCDSRNLEETLTRELVWVMRDFNFPRLRTVDVRFKIDTDASEPEKDLQAAQIVWDMGGRIKEADLMDKVGLSAPGEGDRVLQNPAILQQVRLAEQHVAQQQDGGAVAGLLPGGEPQPMEAGMEPEEPEQFQSGTISASSGGGTHGERQFGPDMYEMPSESIPADKAAEILEHGEVHGEPLTEKQRGLFGAAAKQGKRYVYRYFKPGQNYEVTLEDDGVAIEQN